MTDPGGHEVTELMVSGTSWQWERTNIYAAGGLLATGDAHGLHFHLSDWLGNRRVQVAGAAGQAAAEGTVELQCSNEVWGVSLSCSGAGADATEHHYTGKERDAESGNDYFGARYYSSTLGRWMSPDWSAKIEPVPYAKLDNPQSLNLYAYGGNNPISNIDADGHDFYQYLGAEYSGSMMQQAMQADAARQVNNILNRRSGQDGSTESNGFWSHVGNLFHGHSWGYKKITGYVYLTEDTGSRDPVSAQAGSLSSGFSESASSINPFTSGRGGVVGANQQTFGATTNNYTYGGYGAGLDVGVSIQGTMAWGVGSWSGSFRSVNAALGPWAGSVFWTPGKGGWTGFSFGLGLGLPGLAFEETNYTYRSEEP